MRNKIILFLSLLIPFTLAFIYVWITAADVAFREDLFMASGGCVEKYLNGTLTFTDLWRPVFFCRLLGYHLLEIANIKFFSLNSNIIVLLIPFFILVSAILIYREYRKSLSPYRSQGFIAATFIIIALIIFNVIQNEGLNFAYGLAYQYSMPFLIGSFISIDLFFSKDSGKYWPPAFILSALAVLVFGETKVIPFVMATGVTFLCYLLTRSQTFPKNIQFRVLLISIFLISITFLWIFRISYNNFVPYSLSGSYYTIVVEVFSYPSEALQFLFSAFGASVIGVDAFFAYDFISFHTMVILGIIVVLLYVSALVLFFRSHMYERTYLPFFLIMLTFTYLIFVTFGRLFYAKDVGMASHYTCVSIYGIVAIVWIFIFIFARPVKTNVFLKSTLFTGLAIIFAGLLLTSTAVWRIQPERKAYFERLQDIAMRVDTATPGELHKFSMIDAHTPEDLSQYEEQVSERIRESLRLLRKYNLNVYRAAPADREQHLLSKYK